jgi:hypothetical protein
MLIRVSENERFRNRGGGETVLAGSRAYAVDWSALVEAT